MSFTERRKHPRHACGLAVEVRPAGETSMLSGRLADICLGGCYIATVSPLPPGIAVTVSFGSNGERAAIAGKTITSMPGSGMGIEFTSPAQDITRRIQALIEQINQEDANLAI
jgi:hypothetical protein